MGDPGSVGGHRVSQLQHRPLTDRAAPSEGPPQAVSVMAGVSLACRFVF